MDRCLLQNPLIMAGPGIKAGETASTFTEMVDIMPTLLELAEIDVTHTHFGKSLVDVLGDPKATIRDCAFSEGGYTVDEEHLMENPSGEYTNKGELQHQQPKTAGKTASLRTYDYTYVYRLYEDDELYDRAADPQERINLIHAPELESTRQEMKEKMFDWVYSTADVIPWQGDPRFPKVPSGQHEAF